MEKELKGAPEHIAIQKLVRKLHKKVSELEDKKGVGVVASFTHNIGEGKSNTTTSIIGEGGALISSLDSILSDECVSNSALVAITAVLSKEERKVDRAKLIGALINFGQ